MKTYLKLLSGIVLLLSACSTGTKVTSGGYDDVYFTPGDNPPPVTSNSSPRVQRNDQSSIRSERNQEKSARIVDEYFNKDQQGQKDLKSYRLNDEDPSSASDSLYEENDESLGYDMEDEDSGELSYSTRLRTFYDPYMYDPFWDSYLGWNTGWSIGFGGWYGGWYSPWSYRGWYDPFYAYSWGYYPYYDYPYYGYYGGGLYGGGHWDNWNGNRTDRFYGRQNSAGRFGRGSNAVSYGSNAALRSGNLAGSFSRSNSGAVNYRRGTANPGYSTRQSGTRYSVDPNLSTRSARVNPSMQQGGRNTETLMNLRRSQGSRQGYVSGNNNTPARSASTYNQENSQRYTPTYTRPRTNTQATYNSGAREYSRESFYRSSGSNRYAKPNSYGSAPTRSSDYGSSNNYQRRSATFGSEGNSRSYSSPGYSAPSRSYSSGSNSSGGSYSAPSRSSFSGGGGSYSGGGGGSFSGGGSSSGSSGSSVGGGGGRRR